MGDTGGRLSLALPTHPDAHQQALPGSQETPGPDPKRRHPCGETAGVRETQEGCRELGSWRHGQHPMEPNCVKTKATNPQHSGLRAH